MQWITHYEPRPSHAAGAAAAFFRACQAKLRNGSPHLVMIFASAAVRFMLSDLVASVHEQFGEGVTVLGCTGAGLLADGREHEQTDGLVWMAGHLPDVGVVPFWVSPAAARARSPAAWHEALSLYPEQQPAFVLLSDLYSVDGQALAAALDEAFPGCPKIGGVASSGPNPGNNRLIWGKRVERTGAVGVALWGDLRMVPFVAQGSRPVGPILEVTRARGGSILGLDGKSVLTVLETLFAGLSQADRMQFQDQPGLGLARRGIATDHLQPHDFVVRTMIGFRRAEDALLVGAEVLPGDRVQLRIRDAEIAHESLVHHTQQFARVPSTAAPAAALVFTGQSRGADLFDFPDHDVSVIRDHLQDPPVAGLFTQRELGPVRGRTREHGGSVGVALFYPRGWS